MNDSNDLIELKEKLTQLANQIAESFGVKLDFSNKSVKKVDKILGSFHKSYKSTKNDDGMNGIALEFAAYIIKVIERNFEPGIWKRDHPQLGPNTFPYLWRGIDLFPYAWCQKRIFDGSGDDVWAKFKALVIKHAS